MDLTEFVRSLSDVSDCAVAFSQEQWIVAIQSSGTVSLVDYRNRTWAHLGADATAPVILEANPSAIGALTMTFVEQAPPHRRSIYVGARDDIEEFVCKTLAVATENAAVGVDDDLFDLGADSLVLIEVATSIFEQYGVRLEIQEVFEAGTPAQISQLVKARIAG
ncbi:acyl carrier protein [Rhodococcus pyridinivorans]|nr:acyl carrier protein [Rhodococcus pyridinivorans]